MGAPRQHEVELKRLLVGAGAADKLVAALGVPVRTDVLQANHFFDSGDRRLGRSRFALRLRTEGSSASLTAKGPGRTVGTSTDSRLEAEAEIEPALVAEILAGRTDPLGALRRRVDDPAYADLWRGMEAALGGAPLRCWGHFENRRRTIPVALPSGLCLDVEVDQTRFSDQRLDEEVEIELASEADVAAAEAWLEATTRAAGVETRRSSPKVARFFAAQQEERP